MKPINVISLFSGCGGMDLGFEGDFKVIRNSINPKIHPGWLPTETSESKYVQLPRTNFKIVFANDILKSAKSAWIPYFKARGAESSMFHSESIVDLVKAHRGGDNVFPQADVVIGGFPCQDFSLAGKRNGFKSKVNHDGSYIEIDEPNEENRGLLYTWMRQVIELTQPKIFIAENVKGLVSLPNVKKIIQNDFRGVDGGYHVFDAKVLYAPDYGIPQTRERIFFIGMKTNELSNEAKEDIEKNCTLDDYFDPYPIKTHTARMNSIDLSRYVTANEYICDLPEPNQSSDLSQQSYSKAKWYGSHCQGQNEINIYGQSPTIRAEHHGNIEFRRLSFEHGGKYDFELSQGLQERRLTVRECARLQTFPDDFQFVRASQEFHLNVSDGYKLIGNAVPPLLAFHIAWKVQELWPYLFRS